MTFNLDSRYYATGRDFGIVDSDPIDVRAIEDVFGNDWRAAHIGASNGDDLVWSPGSADALLALIHGARTSLSIYNEEMADPRIVKALIDAAERGVAVNVIMTYSSEWKYEFAALETAGAHIRTYAEDAPLYIHAKMIIADGNRAFVGSENFSKTSLDDNRELGIMMSDQNIIDNLEAVFKKDWSGATPFAFSH